MNISECCCSGVRPWIETPISIQTASKRKFKRWMVVPSRQKEGFSARTQEIKNDWLTDWFFDSNMSCMRTLSSSLLLLLSSFLARAWMFCKFQLLQWLLLLQTESHIIKHFLRNWEIKTAIKYILLWNSSCNYHTYGAYVVRLSLSSSRPNAISRLFRDSRSTLRSRSSRTSMTQTRKTRKQNKTAHHTFTSCSCGSVRATNSYLELPYLVT